MRAEHPETDKPCKITRKTSNNSGNKNNNKKKQTQGSSLEASAFICAVYQMCVLWYWSLKTNWTLNCIQTNTGDTGPGVSEQSRRVFLLLLFSLCCFFHGHVQI